MDLHEHAALGLPGAALTYLVSGDPWAAAAFAAGAVLVDLDHLVDYWRETGLNRDWRSFLGYFDSRRPVHSYLPLHGWEWPLLLASAGLAVGLPAWAWALAAGLLAHLVMDQRYNRLHRLAYFVCYRWAVRFHPWSLYQD